tara:strand:+ start:1127 stop:1393 length:267 start_codon:yes stop_codon:yes gene_type:complete
MLSRADYLESYSPSVASEYTYGSTVPNPAFILKRRIAALDKMKDDTTGASKPELFQRFLILQSDPEALFRSKAKMPDTPFGNLAQFIN